MPEAPDDPPRLYVFDTSSIIHPRRMLSSEPAAEKNRVYKALGAMVEAGTLLYPHQVYEELKRAHDKGDKGDLAYEWAYQYRDAAQGGVLIADLFEPVRVVNEAVPDLVDYDKPSPGDDADPWVVALALHLLRSGRKAVVVTEEHSDRSDKTSMQGACAVLGIPAMSLRVFLKSLGIWPKK